MRRVRASGRKSAFSVIRSTFRPRSPKSGKVDTGTASLAFAEQQDSTPLPAFVEESERLLAEARRVEAELLVRPVLGPQLMHPEGGRWGSIAFPPSPAGIEQVHIPRRALELEHPRELGTGGTLPVPRLRHPRIPEGRRLGRGRSRVVGGQHREPGDETSELFRLCLREDALHDSVAALAQTAGRRK